MPVKNVELNSKDIEIEGDIYTLEREIHISENKIDESSKTITINDDGEIREDSTSRTLARSNSRLSLHGIEVPTSLFPESWRMKNNQAKLSWPFPLVIVLDICGNRDLDLNSSRTEIILSEKWMDLEEHLAFLICSKIAKSVTTKYWNALKPILAENSKNENYLRALNKVAKSKK